MEQYDALVLHQANLYIMQHISKWVKVPMEKFRFLLIDMEIPAALSFRSLFVMHTENREVAGCVCLSVDME